MGRRTMLQLDMRRMPFALMPLLRLLSPYTTYDMALHMLHDGRITEQQWRWYRFFWTWTAPRFSDVENASSKQHRCAKALGYPGLERRFKRVLALRKRYFDAHFAAYYAATD